MKKVGKMLVPEGLCNNAIFLVQAILGYIYEFMKKSQITISHISDLSEMHGSSEQTLQLQDLMEFSPPSHII